MVIYCVTTHPKTLTALGSPHLWFYPRCEPCHMLFREIHRVTPTYLQRYLRSLHVTFNPIAGLSLMATKASQAPHFQQKPTMWELLEEVNLNHRSHRSDTTFTKLPICPHLPLRIVLLWYLPNKLFWDIALFYEQFFSPSNCASKLLPHSRLVSIQSSSFSSVAAVILTV
jgi:hypothetical protein